ncbi:MAG: hypothetical protein ABIT76_04960 [Chthoniobacterales bacterium]
MQEFHWLTAIVAGLSSGLLVAAINHGVSLYREHLDFRQGKLEELHKAVFTLTFKLETILSPLGAEAGMWIALEKERLAGKYVGDKLDVIYNKVQVLADEVLRDRGELLRDLETAVRLISIHFPELTNARLELTGMVQQALLLARNPKLSATDGPNKIAELSTEASRIGHQLTERVWNLHQPDPKWTWLLAKR